MASAAEARIREKADTLLRTMWPSARIVHEFDLGGVRLDLAAITEDRLILVEIKSELDTLTRLPRQAEFALRVGGPLMVVYAPRWSEAIRKLSFSGSYRVNWIEEGDGPLAVRYPRWLDADNDRYDSRALMGLLLKPELMALARPHGAKTRFDVSRLQAIVHENLTGREIRRGVMAALRARRFGWTCDAPIPANDTKPDLFAEGEAA